MKKIAFVFNLFILTFTLNTIAQEQEIMAVEKLSNFDNFYKSDSFYFAGQPNLEALKWLKQEGVKTIINLRSNNENQEFEKQAFSEEMLAQELGFKYISIPMKGKASYNPKTLKEFTNAVESSEGKILVHCKGAGRVTYIMMAYLIQSKAYSYEQAEKFGNQLSYFSTVNALLGN